MKMTSLILFAASVIVLSTAISSAETTRPGTSFQTGQPYRPQLDIKSDIAIVFSKDEGYIRSWAEAGYIPHTMFGFRDYDPYIEAHPEDAQTTIDGTMLTCDPGSYYLAPSPRRVQMMVDHFLAAIRAGSRAIIPEEPEYFAIAGYEQAFRDAWKEHYNQDWQDPASSHDNRIKAEQLKASMQFHLIQSILRAALAEDPTVLRMTAHHSPINYHSWGISFPFQRFASMPELQEVIGQVWTGTARWPFRMDGITAERTFLNALMEYNSISEIYRGTGKRLWFLADPLEDHPDRTMEDYFTNYRHTIVASLQFREVNSYELMPWPERVYGRVPDAFATTIGCVTNALQNISWMPEASGSTLPVGVLIGDSAAYQRAEPHPTDLTGFYGLAAPLYKDGIPARIIPIERTPQPGFLDQFKLILLSYDYFKPMQAEYNRALAQWVKQGGVLVLVGGSDSYNLANQWWRQEGYGSPDLHLLHELGIQAQSDTPTDIVTPEYREIARESRNVRDAGNRTVVRIPFIGAAPEGALLVRFRDSQTADGWGPSLYGLRIVKPDGLVESIGIDTPEERNFLIFNSGSIVSPARTRFADQQNSFAYFFTDLPDGTALEFDVANQYLVETAVLDANTARYYQRNRLSGGKRTGYRVDGSDVHFFGKAYSRARVPNSIQRALEEAASLHPDVSFSGFYKQVGKGYLIQVDAPAVAFAESSQSLAKLFDVAAGMADITVEKPDRYQQDRGPYRAVHALKDGVVIAGNWIDIYDHTLRVQKDIALQKCDSALLRSVEETSEPEILAASYRAQVIESDSNSLRIEASGPEGTRGVIRLALAGRAIESVKAWLLQGDESLEVEYEQTDGTALIQYPQKAKGLLIELVFTQPSP